MELIEYQENSTLFITEIKIIDNIEYYECTKCHDFKTKISFNIDKSSNHGICKICRECSKNINYEYRNSFRGFIIGKLRDAKMSAKKRNLNNKRTGTHGDFTLTINDIFDKILEQNGQCYYSKVPLSFVPNSEWRMSLERLDCNQGYTKTNVVLICVEFNSTDTTARRNSIKGTGSAQWSKEKVALLMDTINKQKPVPTNFQEWITMINSSTLQTHDNNLFCMSF